MFSLSKENKELLVCAPITGKCVDLGEVPDPVFSERMIGDGRAIEPLTHQVIAPCDGKITQIFPTNHAIAIETSLGIDLLIHVGIDTVQLKGEGFERLVEEGAQVKKGEPLIKLDLEKLKSSNKPIITSVLVTNTEDVVIENLKIGDVIAGETVIMKVTPTYKE